MGWEKQGSINYVTLHSEDEAEGAQKMQRALKG